LRTLIDTSVAIALREHDRRILDLAESVEGIALLSILSVVELEAGVTTAKTGAAVRRQLLDQMLEALPILPFGEPDVLAYRQILAVCGFSRSKIIDRLIGAQALVAGARLATLNPRDFRDIPGLEVVDWS
jgi:tRNA(fMet)-specific endonuclease VapC